MSDFTGYAFEKESINRLMATASELPFSLGDVDTDNALDYQTVRDVHPIENQGNMGSCQGHSLSSQLEVIHYLGTGQWVEMSRLHGYLGTQVIDGLLGRDVGSTISGGVKLAREHGLVRESLMPYPNPVRYPSSNAFMRQVRSPEFKNAERFRIQKHVRINSYNKALAFLAGRVGTISLGTHWGVDMDSGAVCRQYNHGSGMHATCIVGVDKTRDDGNGNLLLAAINSHGKSSGDQGWYFWTRAAFERMLSTQHCVAIGISDMPDLQPRDADFSKEQWL